MKPTNSPGGDIGAHANVRNDFPELYMRYLKLWEHFSDLKKDFSLARGFKLYIVGGT